MVHSLGGGAMIPVRRADDERGVILVFTAIFLVVALGILAIVIDLGNARDERRQAQVGADAAALAGAETIEAFGDNFTGTADQWQSIVDQVKAYAKENFNTPASVWNGCTDSSALSYRPDSGDGCISSDSSTWPALSGPSEDTISTRLRVRIPTKSFSTLFAGVTGNKSLSLQAAATATVTRKHTLVTTNTTTQVAGGPCAICLLGSGLTLDAKSNGDISVTGGSIIVDSTASTVSQAGPNSHITVTVPSGTGYIIGGPAAPDGFDAKNSTNYSPSPTYHAAVPDPLAAVPQCGDGAPGSTNYCPTNTGSNGTSNGTTLNPGIYTTISGSHTLNRGIYIVKSGISLSGNDLLQGDGVMIYFACSNYPSPCAAGQTGAGMTAVGNGAVRLNAPTAADCTALPSVCNYVGLLMFADRNNTATATFRGNGSNEGGSHNGSGGTIYMKSGDLDLRGNGFTLASQIVVGSMTFSGNPSGVVVAYDQDLNYKEYTSTTTTTTSDAFSYDNAGLSG